MKQIIRKMSRLLPLLVIAGAMVIGSCGEVHRTNDSSNYKVAIFHSWDSVGEEKGHFSECVAKAFEARGMKVEIHHIYANMSRRPGSVFSEYDWPRYADSLRRWRPDLILLNDDPIVEWVLTAGEGDSIFMKTPTVFAGVSALLRDSLYKFPRMTGFEDRIDLGKNIELMMKITKCQNVVVELDYDSLDMRLYRTFEVMLADSTRFVNNGDFILERLDEAYLREHYPGRAVVNFVSCAQPYMNRGWYDSDSVGKVNTRNLLRRAKDMWHLQVKYDIFSNNMIILSGVPQFTSIREMFNDPRNPLFLCGYFTGTDIQVEDQVEYAARILRGEDPKSLPISVHANDYYMDWRAVEKMPFPIPYEAYRDQFKILNAPFYLEHPILFSLRLGIGLIVIAILVYFVVRFLSRWRRKEQQSLVEELKYEEKIHDLMFSNARDTLWHFHDGGFTFSEEFAKFFGLKSNRMSVMELRKAVHPDSLPSFNFLMNFPHQRGKKTVRLRLSPDDGEHWYWAEVMYTATDDTALSQDLYGLLMNIDQKKETEEKLDEARIMSEQVALKENFLANISHDLRTPLGAVTGFSSLLTMPGMVFEPGEREQYGEIIHQNTDMILKMIDSVVEKTQTDTSDLEVVQKPVSVHKLINECYNTNRIIAPTHLKFILEMAEPDTTLNIDITRTKQVVNNFLSNAFKFTTEGSVTLGWKYMEDDADKIEVYVKDTGIGVAPEKQAMLFERYKKVNETDRGTGLGLNISKNIIEKQGGQIGVESTLGQGSKFFFRLAKYVQCLLLMLSMGLGLLLPSSCTPEYRKPSRVAKVLVIHSYRRENAVYREFDDDIYQEFRKQGIHADIKTMFLNKENPLQDTSEDCIAFQDSMAKIGWAPEVVLTEGDRAAHDLLEWREKGLAPLLDSIPIILGALHHPEWTVIRRYQNIVMIGDPIDYRTNINLAVEMSGKNCVEIELDYFLQDSLIREELRKEIARPPYIDNSDFHIKDIRDEMFSTIWKDSVVVLTFSAESPERNSQNPFERSDGYRNLKTIFVHSWLYPSLAVKKDLYSSAIVDKTGKPQFTAVKAGFADGMGRYLCGYFADYHTVAIDLARVATELMNGADMASFVGMTHEKKYYMDYQAMEALGLDYDDYKKRFIILGAPLEQTMPIVVYGTWIVIALVFIGAIFSVLLIVQAWRDRNQQVLLDDVKRRAEMRQLALNGADSYPVRSEERVKDIISRIHPDHASEIPLMMQAINIEGTHSYDVYADAESDGTYRWWQLRFVVVFDKNRNKRVDGILINIDEAKRYEADLEKAMMQAEEARKKENFLTTVSHEIRTPLNAVVGFCDVIVGMPAESFSDEELAEYAKIIKANNGTLTTMIEDILMFSRIESGRIQYVSDEFNPADLIQELANEWEDIIPEGITFHLIAPQRGVTINNDRVRVKYLLNQFLSNAVKFTKEGIIMFGMCYHLNDDKLEFFVSDSGCGIPKDEQDKVFDLFWKANEFMPGLGLGLHVAQKMAKGMNLQFVVDSKVGIGSKFSLLLDASIRRVDAPEQPSAPPAPSL